MSLTRNIAIHHSPRTKSNSRRLTFSRVRLLRLRDSDLQANALKLWCASSGHGWGGLFTGALGLAAAIGDLVESCEDGWGGREGAADWGDGLDERSGSWAEDRWREKAPYRRGEHDVWCGLERGRQGCAGQLFGEVSRWRV